MTTSEKLEAAIKWLGKRWVLHPSQRIPKGDYSTNNTRTVDVASTFAKARRRKEVAV